MNAKKVKEISARILKVGKSRVLVDQEEIERVKEAITKDDVRSLISEGIIKKSKRPEQSRARARKLKEKKRKGRKKGEGKRRGKYKTRAKRKKSWISKVRAQRRTLKELRKSNPKEVEKIGYGKLYRMIKGGYFKGKKYVEKKVLEGK